MREFCEFAIVYGDNLFQHTTIAKLNNNIKTIVIDNYKVNV